MYVIGVTGGVGAGKSEVLRYLMEEHGAFVVRMDDLGRSLYEKGKEAYIEALRLFGTAVLRKDGTIDLSYVADHIFADPDLLGRMNDVIHPAVFKEIQKLLLREEEKGTRLFVMESALLTGKQYGAICDELWYIYADEATRYRRLRSSRGYSDDRIRQTMNHQSTDQMYREMADAVIDNSSGFEDTRRQIDMRLSQISSGHF